MAFKRAIVTSVGPLRIMIDGDTEPIPFTPKSLIDPATLLVGDVVHADQSGHRLLVLGRVGGLGLLSGRNLIVNGNLRTNQRKYVSATAMGAGEYTLDRWKVNVASGKVYFTEKPQGNGAEFVTGHGIAQVVEQANIIPGDHILSWGGTSSGRAYNAGGVPPAYGASPIVATLDGAANVVVEFQAVGGSQNLSQVQLEYGTIQTPFEGISVGEELALCQRFYCRLDTATFGTLFGTALATRDSGMQAYVQLPATMRAVPTLFYSAVGDFRFTRPGIREHVLSAMSLSGSYSSLDIVGLDITAGSGYTAGQPGVLRGVGGEQAWLGFDAEL